MDEINEMILHLLAAITCGRERACGTKVKHGSEVVAEMHVQRLNARPGGLHHKVEVYPCPWCYQWHVGRPFSTARLRYLSMGVRHERSLAAAAAQGGVHVQDGQDAPVVGAGGGSAQPQVPPGQSVQLVLEEDDGHQGVLVL